MLLVAISHRPREKAEGNERGEPDGCSGERPGAAGDPGRGALPPANRDGFGLPGGGFFAGGDAELGDDLWDVVFGGGEGE
ncbi:MAG: hypothetical protein E6I03_13625 [Chloroflexi bacterium]|nr:MAG: hypothetical protein E6I03_13625 [Chloroflexota bacterium]